MKNIVEPNTITRISLGITLLLCLTFLTEQGFAQTSEIGMASYYNDSFEGRMTASGAAYRKNKLTAAHNTLAFGTWIKVTNLKNGKSVMLEVNDRGPFVRGRILDVSKEAAIRLDFIDQGVIEVRIEVLNDKK